MVEILLIANPLLLLGIYFGFGGFRSSSPIPLFAAFWLARTAPYCWLYYFGVVELDYRIENAIGRGNLIETFELYLWLELLSAVCFFTVLANLKLSWPQAVDESCIPNFVALGIAGVSMATFLYNVAAQGGVQSYLDNFHLRLGIRTQAEVIQIPGLNFFTFAMSGYILLQNYARTRALSTLFVFVMICVAGVMAGAQTGGRKDSILLIIVYLIFCLKFFPRFRLSPFRATLIIALLIVFSNLVATMRRPGGIENLQNMNASEFAEETLFQIVPVIENVSYCSHYMLIIAHFNQAEYWGTGIFESGLQALIPRFLSPNKPPMDEGVYIRSLLEGWRGRPPESPNNLYLSSFPPETLGNGYAAGGFFVVLGFFVIKALFIGLIWRLAKQWLKEPCLTIAVFFVLYQFEISPYRMLQVALVLAYAIFFQLTLGFFANQRRISAN